MKSTICKIMTAALVLAFASTSSTFAQSDKEDTSGSRITDRLNAKVEDTVKSVRNTVDTTVAETDKNVTRGESRTRTPSEKLEDRKTELKEQFKQDVENRKQKLEGRRLAQCENRESAINTLMNKGVEASQDRLARIQRVEAKVKMFYEKQQLSDERYADAVTKTDEKEAAAIAALQVVDDQTFDCTTVDGSDTTKSIRTSIAAKHDALKDYRDSVKQLIIIVKEAYTTDQSTKPSEAQS